MASLRQLAIQDGQNGARVSLFALARSHDAASLQAIGASQLLRDYHRSRGGIFGALGRDRGTIRQAADGSYARDYQLGVVRLAGAPAQIESVNAVVDFMGLKCFSASDANAPFIARRPYVIISIVRLDPTLTGTSQMVQTVKLDFNSMRPGEVAGAPTTIYHGAVAGVTGILIGAAVFEHDHGDPNVVRAAINKALLEVATEAGAAIGAAVNGGADAADAFARNDVAKWTARLFSRGLIGVLGLGEDRIGDKTIAISPSRIEALVNQNAFDLSLISNVLPDGRTFNFPVDHTQLIDGSGARYQVYFRVRGDRTTSGASQPVASPPLMPATV